MIRTALFPLLLVLATASAHAWDDRSRAVVGAGVGAAVGAAIGGELGGRDGAVLGGAVGGAVGVAVVTDGRRDRYVGYRDDRRWDGRNRHDRRRNDRYWDDRRWDHRGDRDDRRHRARGRAHRDFCPPGRARKGRR